MHDPQPKQLRGKDQRLLVPRHELAPEKRRVPKPELQDLQFSEPEVDKRLDRRLRYLEFYV